MTPGVRKGVAGAVALVAMAALGLVIAKSTIWSEPSAADASRHRAGVDIETGQVFDDIKISEGDSVPWKNPKTGKATVYPAESCYWTKDGGAKLEPTYVLLSESVGRPGPTICPDCGRQVVAHNPLPPADKMKIAWEASKKAGSKK